MTKEIAVLQKEEKFNKDLAESFDFDKLEEKLQGQLEEELADMQFLKEEKEKIGNPDSLGNVIMDVVWQQFLNQVAVTAGEDFIKNNRELTLDLRNEAHIQTAENFSEGKFPEHNTKIDYKDRYDKWQDSFQRNEDGSIRNKEDYRTKEQRAVLRVLDKKKDPDGINYNTNYDARKFIDDGRPKGSKTVNKDHTISAAEIIRDPEAAAHLSRDEQATFANSDKNLVDLDSAANQSKKDSSMTEWLDSKREGKHGKGQTQAEYFGLDEKDLRNRDKEARKEYAKVKEEGERKSIEAGKQSQKEEAFRIGGTTLRAVFMAMLAGLVKEIIAKLVKWFKSAKRALGTLLDSLKEAVQSFVVNIKKHLINAGNTALTTISTAIIGPVVGTIKKVWILLKQSWSALRNAVNYFKDSSNKNKPLGIRLMEAGKIIIAGLTGAGALILGEVIEKGLMTIPAFAIQIPLLGSLASILGIFFGAVVAGIIGAIAINLIEKRIEKNMKEENINAQIEKGNEILNLQNKVQVVNEAKLENTKYTVTHNIHERHVAAANIMIDSLNNIRENCAKDKKIQDKFKNIDKLLEKLEN